MSNAHIEDLWGDLPTLNFDIASIDIPVVRRALPSLLADDIVGVQPMADMDFASLYPFHVDLTNESDDIYNDLTDENEIDYYLERIGYE